MSTTWRYYVSKAKRSVTNCINFCSWIWWLCYWELLTAVISILYWACLIPACFTGSQWKTEMWVFWPFSCFIGALFYIPNWKRSFGSNLVLGTSLSQNLIHSWIYPGTAFSKPKSTAVWWFRRLCCQVTLRVWKVETHTHTRLIITDDPFLCWLSRSFWAPLLFLALISTLHLFVWSLLRSRTPPRSASNARSSLPLQCSSKARLGWRKGLLAAFI